MCAPSRLQQHIRNLTKDGEVVARFLVDTVQAKTPGVKTCHQMEAMKYLVRFGFTDEEQSHFWGLVPTPEELAATPSHHSRDNGIPEGGETENSKLKTVNSLDILNYDIAHLIRKETADGHTIAEFLADVMTRQDKPYTPKKLRIKPADRMAASREILRRGFGHFGRKRKLVVDDHGDNNYDANDYDTLHTDLAKRMREYSEQGTDAVRFLLDVMSAADPDEPYTWHHRMSAAQELLRRGWDTNYDRITPEMLQEYWRDQQSTRLSVGQKKHLAGLSVSQEDHNTYDSADYQAMADALHEQQDLKAEEKDPFVLSLSKGESASNPDTAGNRPPLSKGEGWGEGEIHPTQTAPITDNKPDCYHEPLTPEQQAIFDYQCKLESGEFEEGEISIVSPSEAARRQYAIDLKKITELAATEGVPLLPNPLAGTLKRPNIRGP